MANLGNKNINAVDSNSCNSNIILVPIAVPNAVGQASIHDVCSSLQPSMGAQDILPGTCPYDHIIDMMRGLDLQDDGIIMNHKIKSIETDFCNIVRNEDMLSECMEYMNNVALNDDDTSLKFALLFSSRNFDALAMNETKVRCTMLKILETNFLNADIYRVKNKDVLYNSITMLGEYYHRVCLADNSPITILGESLLSLLIREVSEPESVIDAKLAKVILSQITLNGDIMRAKHKVDLSQLLYHIRRNMIEQHTLKASVKALLLMTLDLYYSSFANFGAELEELYKKYLIQNDEEESNNNLIPETLQQERFQPQMYQQPLQQPNHQPIQLLEQHDVHIQPTIQHQDELHNSSYEAVNNGNVADYSYEVNPMTKKWSEQVCEESFYEKQFGTELNLSGGDTQDEQTKNIGDLQQDVPLSNSHVNNERESNNSRRSYNKQNRISPRPFNQNFNAHNSHPQSGEERDQSKPLPRWRVTRFNRDSTDQQQNYRINQRRYSTSYDDDRQSVRSDNGGSGGIRLYSVNDRLKHSQEKIDRSNNTYNSIANSNWDRQSQRDDHSERSYMSNYERGNHRRGSRQYNNRHTYDKPPRFQKNQHYQQSKDSANGSIKSDSWRRSITSSLQDENFSYSSNGSVPNSSSHAHTLPRPGKSKFESNSTNSSSSSYRKSSQSPKRFSGGQYNRGHNRSRNYNIRYNSQGSLNTTESSTPLDRRHHNRNHRSFERPSRQSSSEKQEDWEDTQSGHDQSKESALDSKENSNELVENARNTTEYMNYLSSKK